MAATPTRVPSPPVDAAKSLYYKQKNRDLAAQKALQILATCTPENDEAAERSSTLRKLNYVKGSVQHAIQIKLKRLRAAKTAKIRRLETNLSAEEDDDELDNDDGVDDKPADDDVEAELLPDEREVVEDDEDEEEEDNNIADETDDLEEDTVDAIHTSSPKARQDAENDADDVEDASDQEDDDDITDVIVDRRTAWAKDRLSLMSYEHCATEEEAMTCIMKRLSAHYGLSLDNKVRKALR